MKIAACYVLHYGREWLGWSIRSVRDFVDDIYVFYSSNPSHGHGTTLKNPETRDELHSIVYTFGGEWVDCGPFEHEGYHRTYAVETLANLGYDLVMVVDTDEIWDPVLLSNTLKEVERCEERNYVIGARHFWRSLKWVCDDPACPTRFIKPRVLDTTIHYLPGKFFHMGYAQTPEIVFYKQAIHGHLAEWRPGWFENIFLPWQPGMMDVHPTSVNYWNPQPFVDDKNQTLKWLVGDHPYWSLDIIS